MVERELTNADINGNSVYVDSK